MTLYLLTIKTKQCKLQFPVNSSYFTSIQINFVNVLLTDCYDINDLLLL